MPQQITKDLSPDDIKQMAEEYQTLLKAANVQMKIEQTIADMERRCAEMNQETVEQWRARWANAPAEPTLEPEPKKAKAKERGTVTEIDRDYFYIDPVNQVKSQTWVKLRKEMGIVMNMLVIGPSGCGKTELFKHLGAQFDVPVYKVDCASITTPDKWVGHKELVATDKGQETHYVLSQHLKWLSATDGFAPGIVLYDEINRLPATLLNTLIPILDGSQRVWVPDLGTYADVHPDTMFAATANLGVGYSGTHAMDIALMDRFGSIMKSTFPPEAEEIKVLMRRTGIDEAKAKILVNIAKQCRAQAVNGELSKFLSTRALLDCGYWVAAGMKIVDAADATFIQKFSEEGGAQSEQAIVTIATKGIAGIN